MAGWVRTRREPGKDFSFIEINDGSTIKNLQIVADSSLAEYASLVTRLTVGSAIFVRGKLVESPGKGQSVEVKAESIECTGLADASYPLQKKRHSFEFLREIAHLRGRTNTLGAIMRLRNAISFAIHRFFQENDFYYVHTPIITASDAEGAGQMFQVTTLDLATLAQKQIANIDYNQDFFHVPTYLTVSGQLEGECYAMALGRIYTFGPTFRAENSNTSRHLSEFWMVEPEMAFATLEDDAELAESFLKYIFKYLLDHCADDLQFFAQWIDREALRRLETLATSSFKRITYTEAIDILKKANQKFEFPVDWGRDLQSEHERFLTEKHFKQPLIVTDYPRDIKAFYMRLNDDEKTVRAMDVLVPCVGEIIGGSEREERVDVLEARMREQGLDLDTYGWYVDLRRFGSAPHAGFGLGLERLVQFISGMENIRDVIPFPRTPGHARF